MPQPSLGRNYEPSFVLWPEICSARLWAGRVVTVATPVRQLRMMLGVRSGANPDDLRHFLVIRLAEDAPALGTAVESFDEQQVKQFHDTVAAALKDTTKTGHRLRVEQKPVIRVVGRPFYDAVHGKKCTPNRRRDNPRITVWEIHPVMQLAVINQGNQR
jgi:hypothetical protein